MTMRNGYHCHIYEDPETFASTTVVHRTNEPEEEDHTHEVRFDTQEPIEFGPAIYWTDVPVTEESML